MEFCIAEIGGGGVKESLLLVYGPVKTTCERQNGDCECDSARGEV
jgi:hypothetical protein